MKKSLEFHDALAMILDHVEPLSTELLPLSQIHNRFAGNDFSSREGLPLFNNSAMDGFAVHSDDVAKASAEQPVVLRVVEEIFAGDASMGRLERGTAVKIMTGAPVPEGADAVVKIEDTEIDGDKVKIFTQAPRLHNVRLKGEDISENEIFISRGDRLTPGRAAMLAAQNYTSVEVYRKPVVALLATGNEIVPPGEPLRPGMIRSSNSTALMGMVLDCGGSVLDFGIARDDEPELEKKLHECLTQDVVITTGGVSVGDRDLVIPALEKNGVELIFWKSRVKPGKPLVFGKTDRTLVFGLPGNSVSSMITFEMFVRPALLKLQGATRIFRDRVQTVMEDEFSSRTDRMEFIRTITRYENGTFYSRLTGPQGSAILTSMVHANSIVQVPADMKQVRKGDILPCILLGTPSLNQ